MSVKYIATSLIWSRASKRKCFCAGPFVAELTRSLLVNCPPCRKARPTTQWSEGGSSQLSVLFSHDQLLYSTQRCLAEGSLNILGRICCVKSFSWQRRVLEMQTFLHHSMSTLAGTAVHVFLYEGFDLHCRAILPTCVVGQAAQKPSTMWGYYIPHLPNKVSNHISLVPSTDINWPDIGSGQAAVQVQLCFIGWWWS